MKIIGLVLITIIILGLIGGGVVLAQDPTVEPDPTFPEAPPELPSELPQDPGEVLPLLEILILFGAGLVAKFIPDLAKMVPWVNDKQGENVRRGLLRIVAIVASVVVAMVLPFAGAATDWLTASGTWAAILAILAAQWGTYRGDKLLRIIGKNLLTRVVTDGPSA